MNLLTISLDRSLFDENSDSALRMTKYAELAGRIDVIVFSPQGFAEKKLSDKVCLYPTNSVGKLFYIPNSIRLGKRLMNRKKVDVVASQDPFLSGISAYLLAGKKRAKLLVGVFGTNIYDRFWLSEKPLHRILKVIGHIIFKRADAIQTDGFETIEVLKKHYGQEKVFWKPLIPGNISEFKIEKKFNDDIFKILFINRLVKQKNLPMFLDVMEKIIKKERSIPVRFTIISGGPLKEFLLSEIEKRGLRESVEYIERVPRKEIIEFFQNHDLLVLTSIYEGFPRAFMEAAAIGLPIVTTRVSGLKNLIKDKENSFVIEQGDTKSFVAAVETLIADRELLLDFSEKIKNNFWEKYSFEKALRMQSQVYKYLEGN